CDDVCVPAGAVCCNVGNGAICPLGYACGTNASTPCIKNTATIITIQPPAATCPLMCRAGGCPVTFDPSPASARVGDPVYWNNLDDVAHTLMNASTGGTPLTTAPANGMSGGIQFTQAGTYTIGAMDCEHPTSTGYLARHQVTVTVN
ncbi:MAG: hypothetical protein AB7L28_28760, partial [Kofleriaceae bacterium]